jgi:glyoxylase-like metal-dependent hydrolase (beta-lactamase superfamily II)
MFQQIDDGLYRVKSSHSSAGAANAGYLLIDEEIAIIDTGLQNSLVQPYLDAVYAAKRSPVDVKWILLSHAHHDHIGGANLLKTTFPEAKIVAPEALKETLNNPSYHLQTHHFNITRSKRLRLAFRQDPFDNLEKIKVDEFFNDGDKISLGEGALHVVSFNGHSIGHSLFFLDRNRVMFSGDALSILPQKYLNYYIDLTGDAAGFEKELKFLSRAKINTLCPIHTEPSLKGPSSKSMVQATLEGFKMMENQILEGLTKELTSEALTNKVTKVLNIKWSSPYDLLAREQTIIAHLKKLETEGKVVKVVKDKKEVYSKR